MADKDLSESAARRLLHNRIDSIKRLITLDRYIEWCDRQGYIPDANADEFHSELKSLEPYCSNVPWRKHAMGLSLAQAVLISSKTYWRMFVSVSGTKLGLHEVLFLPSEKTLASFGRVRTKITNKLKSRGL